jgi:PAS domain S-box-containing protein
MKYHEYFQELLNNPQNAFLEENGTVFINQLLSVLLKSSSDYICILNSNFDVLIQNEAFHKRIKSHLKDDLKMGMNFVSNLDTSFSKKWRNVLNEALMKGTYIFEERFEKDEEIIPVKFQLERINDNRDTQGIVVLGFDLIEDKTSIDVLKDRDIAFKALTENLKSAVFTFNDEGYFIYANPATEMITGYSAEELKQMYFFDIVHPEYRDLVKEKGLNRLKGHHETPTYEFKIICKNQSVKWVEITNTRVNLRNQSVVLGTAIDITERKQAETQLKIEQAYFEKLFENSPEAIVITSNDGIIEHVNNEFTRLFGYTKEEAVGKAVDDLISSREQYKEATDKTRTIAKGERISAETIRKHKDGHLINVSILGAPIEVEGKQRAVYGIYRDITDRVRTQEALKESKAQLQYVLNNTKDIIFQVDLNGNFIFINKAAENMTGYVQDEILTKSFYDVVAPEYHPFLEERVKKRMARETLTDSFKFEIVTKNKQRVWVELTTSPVVRQGEVIGVQGVARDISERIEFEEQLKRAKEKAEEADHLKSAFLANMSHEIRTPMNAILGFSNLLNNPAITKEQQEEYIEIINSRGNQLLQVINDIIDLSKIESNQLKLEEEQFNLNHFLKEIHSSFRQAIKEEYQKEIDIKLEKGENDEKAIVKTDKTRLEQILSYLLNNAVKYTQEGMIRFGYVIEQGASEQHLKFYIQDTGVGIPESKQDVIFERFRQSDDSKTREYGGTGLGLSISKGLVEIMGGVIWLNSVPAEGTTFYFSLPYKKSQEINNSQSQNKNTQYMNYNWSGKTILIVEDDPLSSKFLEAILEDSGAQILLAKDGKEAIDIAKKHESLDMILMDIQLPGMNGNEATIEIRKIRENIPVIAQTAHAMPEDKKKSLEAGCDDYITKPINMDLLLDKIESVFKKYENNE